MSAIAPERYWTHQPRRDAQQPPSASLRCPETPLGRARAARGWSQAKAVRALLLAARQRGWDIAAESSLKIMLCRWENQQHRPGEMYRVLLCSIYRSTPEELGLTHTAKEPRGASAQELREHVASLENLVRQLSDQLTAVTAGGAQ
jgi:hypothetical protein